jgi:hypothetical protein
MISKLADILFWIGITLTIWSAKLSGYEDTVISMKKLRNEGWARR